MPRHLSALTRAIRTGRVRAVLRAALVSTVATALTLTAAACGGDKDADGKTLKLGYYAAAGTAADTTMRKLVADFEKANPGIKVTVEVAPYTQFFQRLRTEVAGGRAPDVWLSDGVLVQEFANRGSLRDLSDKVTSINAEDFYGLDLNRDADGKLYAFPQGVQTPVLFYNKKLFAEAGVAEPTADWTYDDLAAAAKKLTRDTNGDGKPDVYGMRVFSPGFTESWWPIIKAFGGDIVTDGNRRVVVDSPEAAKALGWMRDAMYGQKFAPDVVTTSALGNVHQLFASGRVAMSYGIYARTLPAIKANVDFGVAPMPKGPGGGRGNVAIVNSWVVNRAASDAKADAAWKWIQYFSGEGPQTTWAQLGEAIPVNKKVASSAAFLKADTPPANRQVFLDALADATDLGTNGAWSEYTTALDKQIEAALAGDKPVADALHAGQADAQQIIDRASTRK